MNVIKQLWLAVALIAAASLLLLISDRGQRVHKKAEEKYPRIAIMQISSTQLLDSHVAGVMDRLESANLVAPGRKNIHHYNPQGDFPTANTIARDIVNSRADIVITSSTLALQIFSKANVTVQKHHVFGAVTDPYGAGVGITGKNPEDHPPYMAGIGTFQPVERAFIIAREMNPGLKKVGVVWNSGEQCSEACTMKARAICEKLEITLIEAVVGNTSEVSEAARSVISKGAEAIWIGGDTIATSSVKLLVGLASQAGIPVFTNDPTDVDRGALFGVGADYFTVGQYTGEMAIEILKGKSPSAISIENVIPELLMVNHKVLDSLDDYRLTPEIESVLREQKDAAAEKDPPEEDSVHKETKTISGRRARVSIINLIENPTLEQAVLGVKEGLKYGGMFDDRNMSVSYLSAQGDMSILPQIIEKAVNDRPDVIVTVTTPVQGAVIKRVKEIPVVFTVASDPYKQGLFTPETRPVNVCGVHDDPPVAEVLEMAANYLPGLKKVGTIYDASQVNSLISVEKLRKAAEIKHIQVLEATVTNVTEIVMATQSLIQRGAQALMFSADNLVYTGFGKIAEIADAHNIPTFATEPDLVDQHITGAYGDSFFDWGVQSGKLAAKILAGASPMELPIEPTKTHRRIDPKPKSAIPFTLNKGER